MLIIKHRWNDLDIEHPNNFCDGAEIDIRIHNNELVVQHDPFKEGITLENWLKSFNKKFLIANVKEEGLVPYLSPELKKSNISDYFILDETIPFIIKHSNEGNRNFGIRVSIWEPVEAALKMLVNLKTPPKWIWVDTFYGRLPLTKREANELRDAGAKLCLVSPELHPDYTFKSVDKEFLENVKKIGLTSFDAVCTKLPKFWAEQNLHSIP